MKEINEVERLRRNVLIYAASGFLLTGVLVAAIAGYMGHKYQEKEALTALQGSVRDRMRQVEGTLERACDIALQVGSRTRLREKLSEYNSGGCTREELMTFSQPKIADALSVSDDIARLVRFDLTGSSYVTLGEVHYEGEHIAPSKIPQEPTIENPFRVGGEYFYNITSPIRNRAGELQGADIITFRFQAIANKFSLPDSFQLNGKAFIAWAGDDGDPILHQLAARAQAIAINSESREESVANLKQAVQAALGGKSGIFECDCNENGCFGITAVAPIELNNWAVVLAGRKADIFAPVHLTALLAGSVLFGVVALATVGMILLLRPLTGKMLLRTSELRQRIDEQTMVSRASEARYRALFDNLNDAVFVHRVTRDGGPSNFIQINNVACQRLGYSQEEMLNMSPGDIDVPELADDLVPEVMETLKNEGHVLFEMRHLTRDGKKIPVEIMAHTFEMDGHETVISVARDISERKEAEVKLAEAFEHLQQLEQIINLSPAVAFVWAAEEGLPIDFASNNIAQFGFSAERLMEDNANFLELVHEEDRTKLADTTQEYVEGGREEFQIEFRITTADGEVRWLDAHIWIRRSGSAAISHYQGVAVDVTERKELDEAVIRTERLAAVGTLASGVAHEFNNIHAGLLGFLELILDSSELTERDRKRLQMVRDAARRGSDITRSLLTFARQGRSKIKLDYINDAVQDILGLVQNEYESEGIDFEVHVGNLPPVEFDRGQLGQVILNFLINASHALLGREQKRITITTGMEGAFAFIAIADTGCGMDAATVSQIFSPFFTTKGEHAEQGSVMGNIKGTGLGLSVCETLIREHQGRIDVDSTLGTGSTFTIYLPLPREVPDMVNQQPFALAESMGWARILILEDEDLVRDMLNETLEEAGFDVFATDNGEEALLEHAQLPFDLCVVDLQMPIMDGETFIKRLRQHGHDIPSVVVVTGRYHEKDIDIDADAFLQKPFTGQEICVTIQHVLEDRLAKERDNGTRDPA